MFKLFEIKEGKFKALPQLDAKHIKGFIIVSVVTILISFLSLNFKISEKNLWKIYTLIIQKLGFTEDVPDLNQKRLDAKVEVEVDRAISEYQRLTGNDGIVKIPKPIYSESAVDESVCYTKECQSLGGEIRLCAPWVSDCSLPSDEH